MQRIAFCLMLSSCVCVCVCACVRACVRSCVRASCLRACVRAGVRTCVCVPRLWTSQIRFEIETYFLFGCAE